MARIAITGGTKGIGRALALKFAKEGHDIAVCARSVNDLGVMKEELTELNPHGTMIMQVCDVSKKDELQSFSEAILGAWSGVDVLINNAGVFIPGSIEGEEDGVFERTMETNVYGAYYLTRLLLPTILDQGRGHIFNMCSTASKMAYANGGSYCISKFAMLGFSKVLREELKDKGVRVTAVLPGPTLTASWDGVDLPKERFMAAADVADIVFHAYQLPPATVIEELEMRPQLGDI